MPTFTFSTRLFLTTLCLVFSQISYAQFQIPSKPSTAHAVYDYAQLLTPQEKATLENKLIRYADSTSTQMVIAIIPNLQNEYIGTLAPQWAHSWGIGNKENDNGVFILLSKDDRKIWIAPGYGLEHLLTAGVNGALIRKHIIPHFKQNHYYAGLDEGTTALMQLFSGTYKASPTPKEDWTDLWILLLFIAVFILFVIFTAKNKGGRGGGRHYQTETDLTDFILLGRMGSTRGSWSRGGFGSGGNFGSGGFSGGFGGGSFSGGGAGGSW